MKASKRIFVWIIISLVLQCSLYMFLDKIYYAEEGNIKIYKDTTTDDQQNKVTPNVVLNNNAKNISLSDDLSYTAYLSNGHVIVVDTNTGKARGNLNYSSGVQCLSYKWVPSTDRIMIAEKISPTQIRFYSYDAENQVKSEVDDTLNKRINSVPAGQTVNMQISDLTGLLYIKVGYSSIRDNIYRIDRNEILTRSVTGRNIGAVALASDDDQLAYEDLASGTIRTNYSPKAYIAIPGVSRPSIIGTDSNDNFYIGNGREQSSVVYCGKLTENTSAWKKIQLGSMVNNDSIVVKENGNVYIVDREKSTVTDVKSNKSYNYQGNFCEINDEYIVYTNGGKLMIKQMK